MTAGIRIPSVERSSALFAADTWQLQCRSGNALTYGKNELCGKTHGRRAGLSRAPCGELWGSTDPKA